MRQLRGSRCSKSPLSIQLREVFEQLQDLRLRQAQYKAAGKRDELALLKTEEGLLESRMESLRQSREEEDEGLTVGPDDVAEIIAMWTGIPMTQIAEEESRRLLDMESELREHIVGQDEAIETVAKAVRRARAGLKDPHRPIGSFIFLGPTGVGKTELSKALARFLFGTEEALVQIDMSEFQERHAAARLVGAPPGYVGYDDAGQLTEAVRRRPYRVILFDEIEKAHPEVWNTLLQILDDGRLTDGQGRVVDFRNTVLIMTSNLGTEYINRGGTLGFIGSKDEAEDREAKLKVDKALKSTFRPEFLNRIDEIIMFSKLSLDDMKKIVDIQMEEVRQRLSENGIEFELDDDARQWLATIGYDQAFGARPLKRALQKYVESPISTGDRDSDPDALLAGKYRVGDVILVDCGEDGIKLRPAQEPELLVEL